MSEFQGSMTPPREETNRVDPSGGNGEPIRMWDLLNILDDKLRRMNNEELYGALQILGPLSAYLNRIYFEEQTDFNRRSLVKTIEELFEIGMEIDSHGGFVSTDGEDSE